MNKKIINKVILIIGILIIVILPIILQKTGAINRIANLLKAENEENMETAVKYEITKTEGENISIIITVESAKGIEKIMNLYEKRKLETVDEILEFDEEIKKKTREMIDSNQIF